MSNPFTDLAEQTKAPTTPEQAVQAQGNPFTDVAQRDTANPFLDLASGNTDTFALRTATIQAGTPPFAERHPIINAVFVEPMKDFAEAMKTLIVDASDRNMRAHAQVFGVVPPSELNTDPTKPIRTPDYYESYGEFLARRSSEGDPLALESFQRTMRGAALLGSFVGAPLLRAVPGATRVLGRAGSFLTGEFLGGSIYGGLRPLDEGETRAQAVLGEGALFATIGGALYGAGLGYKRFILALPRAKRIAAMRAVQRGLDDLTAQGIKLDDLPTDQRAAFETPILAQAIREAEPGAVDLEAIAKAEADRAIEPTPRFGAERGTLNLEPPPGERPLDLPEQQFRQVLEKMEPLKVPPKVEPAVAPKGFVTGAGTSGARLLTEPEFDKLYVHRAYYQEGYLPPERRSEVAASISQRGLLRGPHNPVLARKISDVKARAAAGDFGERTTPHSVYAITDYPPERKIGMDVSLGDAVPPERILAVLQPREGESLYQAYTRQNSPEAALEETAAQILEPRQVTLPTAPPKGFEPTAAGAEATGAPGQVQELALADASIEFAVARIDPLEIASPQVKSEAVLTEQLVGDPIEPGRGSAGIRQTLDRALAMESPAAEQGVVLDLSQPQPWEIALDRKVTPGEAKQVRKGIAAALRREIAPIEFESAEQVKASWMEPQEIPVTTPGPQDGFEIAVKLTDEQMEQLARGVAGVEELPPVKSGGTAARGYEGQAKGIDVTGTGTKTPMPTAPTITEIHDRLMGRAGIAGARTLLTISGSGLEALSFNDNLSDSEKVGLRAVGGFMIAAGLSPVVAEWAQKTNFTRKLIQLYNPSWLLSHAGSKEGLRQYVETMTYARTLGSTHAKMIRNTFGTPESQRALMYVLDEGKSAPEWHLLSPTQQNAATAIHQLNLRLGMMLKANGILDEYVENYVRHLLPPESFQRWRTTGFRTLPTSGGFTKPRHILALRDLETWAAQQGVAGPIMDPALVQGFHLVEAYKAVGNSRVRQLFEQLGMIADAPKSAYTAIPANWRQIRIAGLGTKMAPDDIAQALENMANPASGDVAWVNAADTLKTWWMKSIMFWWWEHGLNVLRSLPAVAMNPVGVADSWRAVRANDPGLVEAAKHGLNLFSRPDFGARAAEAFEQNMQRLGAKSPTLAKLGRMGGALMEKNDRFLWDQIVPSLQYFAYSKEMANWADKTGGKFLPKSPEYIAAARRSADYANTIAGKMPQELIDPTLARRMRLLLFSPQWTMSRIALTAHAAGELGEIAAGRLDPSQAMYLPFKMRQLAWGIALTYAGSKLLSGKEPEFNPNTSKFYMRTGLRGANGREVGIDLLGWWQQDLQQFSHPMDYISSKLNPVLKIAGETISGRDYLGREMTTGQKITNIFRSFGPPSELTDLAIRELQGAFPGGAPGPTAGERLQRISGILATGNVASLPRPVDVTIGKLAGKLLAGQHLPVTSDNIFELSRLLRSNILSGNSIIDGRVITYLSYKRRAYQTKEPIGAATGAATDYLWQQGRRVLADF